jgi:hypothetical protein
LNRSLARRNADLLDYVNFGARRFDFLGQKAIYTNYISQLYSEAEKAAPTGKTSDGRTVAGILRRISGVNGLAQDLRDASSALRERYRSLWLGEERPYYLDNILARYDSELARWNNVERRFNDILADYRTSKRLPPLVEGAAAPATEAPAHAPAQRSHGPALRPPEPQPSQPGAPPPDTTLPGAQPPPAQTSPASGQQGQPKHPAPAPSTTPPQ